MMTFTGSIVAVLKLTAEWKPEKKKFLKTNVRISKKGVATFSGSHNIKPEDEMGEPKGDKQRQNNWCVTPEFSAQGAATPAGGPPEGIPSVKFPVYKVLTNRTVQLTIRRGRNDPPRSGADFPPADFDGSKTFTASWELEVKNFWHIDTKARTYCGGKIPQLFCVMLMLTCCSLIWSLDENGLALYQNSKLETTWANDSSELLGTLLIVALALLAGLVGILQALAVSGADMAVVICILNSGSGWSGVAAGFMISNELLLVTGAFVGASGAILSYLMCQAMNVPMLRVLGMQPPPKKTAEELAAEKERNEGAEELREPTKIKTADAVTALRAAKTVVIAPGYGMAAGKAQGVVGDLAKALVSQGKEVRFCIHPVAGRLPGHMNILLAEAQVPYDWVCAMDEINSDFKNTDVAICVGAWDTVNPNAEDPDSPVFGMPMCRVWDAKTCIVNKRSLNSSSGFSGAVNTLPHQENVKCLLGSAGTEIKKIVDEISKDATAAAASDGKATSVAKVAKGPTPEEQALMDGDPKKHIFVPKETSDPDGNQLTDLTLSLERRCAMTPAAAENLRKMGFRVTVEAGIGVRTHIADAAYAAVGVDVVQASEKAYQEADVVLKLNPPIERKEIGGKHELDMMSMGSTYIGFLPVMGRGDTPEKHSGGGYESIVLRALEKKINLLSMGHLPRISRAQKSDALSTFGKLAGHRACIEAAAAYGRLLPGEITSAGKNPQATAWVGGCGVAGLEAVAILKKMGCQVYATDVRDVEDQVLSVGGTFVHYDPEGLKNQKDAGGYAPDFSPEGLAQMKIKADAMYTEWSAKCDVMVLTAAIPGRPPPQFVNEEMVKNMQPGSVIVDIAASHKWAKQKSAAVWPGNCELTQPGQAFTTANGVTIIGYTDMPSRFSTQATDFYSNNLVNLLKDMCVKGDVESNKGKEPAPGDAGNFKIDMHVVREQKPGVTGDSSYARGVYAIGDDIMAGMCLVKVEEDHEAFLDYPKPPPKSMATAQSAFEKEKAGLNLAQLQEEETKLKLTKTQSKKKLMDSHSTEELHDVHKTVKAQKSSSSKIESIKTFEEAKAAENQEKWIKGMIKKAKQEKTKAEKERLLAEKNAGGESSMLSTVVMALVGLGFLALMAWYPFPPYFIGNMMIFVLASVLGYCLVASVKPSLHTPLMSMSNAISGIVIVGGMLQIQGKWLWGGDGWSEAPAGLTAATAALVAVDPNMVEGSMTATQVLGAIAVAISAVNIAGGFAVTFRMLEMFKKAD
jgi:NAD(P) transhydrogenase alpha subunit